MKTIHLTSSRSSSSKTTTSWNSKRNSRGGDEEELDEEEDELELDELLELELDELPELEDEPVGVVGVSPQPTRKAPAAVDAAPDNSNRNSRRSGVSSLTVGGNFLLAMI